MQSKIIHFFVQFLLFCSEYHFIRVNALVGDHVEQAIIGEFPSVVCLPAISIQNNEPTGTIICSGTFISMQHVLTAEHCFEDLNDIYLQVYSGSITLKRCQKNTIMWWLTFDQWATAFRQNILLPRNDIAVLKLIQPAPRQNIPAELSDTPVRLLFGLHIVIQGWGDTSDNRSPTNLQKGVLKIIDYEECSSIIRTFNRRRIVLDEPFLCTINTPHIQVQHGDAGGPIFHENTILGISNGKCPDIEGMSHGGSVNVYSSVKFYKNFIYFTTTQ